MTLTVVCGLPGVGKTTKARELAAESDATVLRTDVVRKDIVDDPTYSTAETDRTYEEVLRRARRLSPEPVVLDGTFRRKRHRDLVVALADDLGVDCRFVKIECDEAIVRRRIRERTDDESDADFAVYQEVEFEPLTRDAEIVDNTPEKVEVQAQV